MTSALQRLRAANADPIGPATSVSAQASRARHWPSLIALGRRAECKFILHLWKAMTKLTSYQLESNTDPSFPFVDPLPKRYMCCISAGLTWRLRQRSAIWRSTCSSELLTLLQARMRFSILRTESKGPALSKAFIDQKRDFLEKLGKRKTSLRTSSQTRQTVKNKRNRLECLSRHWLERTQCEEEMQELATQAATCLAEKPSVWYWRTTSSRGPVLWTKNAPSLPLRSSPPSCGRSGLWAISPSQSSADPQSNAKPRCVWLTPPERHVGP